MHEWNHLEWKFNPKISPCNHDPVKCSDNVFKVVNRLWFFYLSKDGESHSLFIHDCVYIMNICRRTHKRQCDQVGAVTQPPAQIFAIFFRKCGHAHSYPRQIEPFVIGDNPTINYYGVHAWANDFSHLQFDAAVVYEDHVSRVDVTRQSGKGCGNHMCVTRTVFGRDNEFLSHH